MQYHLFYISMSLLVDFPMTKMTTEPKSSTQEKCPYCGSIEVTHPVSVDENCKALATFKNCDTCGLQWDEEKFGKEHKQHSIMEKILQYASNADCNGIPRSELCADLRFLIAKREGLLRKNNELLKVVVQLIHDMPETPEEIAFHIENAKKVFCQTCDCLQSK